MLYIINLLLYISYVTSLSLRPFQDSGLTTVFVSTVLSYIIYLPNNLTLATLFTIVWRVEGASLRPTEHPISSGKVY